MEIKLKQKYTIPSAHRGRSYRSTSQGQGASAHEYSGPLLAVMNQIRKASRTRNAKIKVSLILDGGRKIRKERIEIP